MLFKLQKKKITPPNSLLFYDYLLWTLVDHCSLGDDLGSLPKYYIFNVYLIRVWRRSPVNVAPKIEDIVSGEEDILMNCPSSTPYVEAVEESLETSFQELEIVNNAYVEAPPVQPRLSSASLMVARVMLRDVYEPEMGLGWNGNGTTSLVRFVENHGRYGLGYEPTHADKRKVALERKERSLAYLQGWGQQIERVPICHISKSFVSAGWMHQNQVAVLDEETNRKQPSWV